MIYSNDFVWLHFPKCAGTKIERLFAKYFSDDNTITQDVIDSQRDPLASWHDSIRDRESRDPRFFLGNKAVLCSFRRLPSWLESRYSFEYRRSPHLNHSPENLLEGKFLERDGWENNADLYARKYVPETILGSGRVRFIRTEYFEKDFNLAFGPYVDVSRIPSREFDVKVNASESCVPPEIRERLYTEQASLYEKCPYWDMVEKLAYDSSDHPD